MPSVTGCRPGADIWHLPRKLAHNRWHDAPPGGKWNGEEMERGRNLRPRCSLAGVRRLEIGERWINGGFGAREPGLLDYLEGDGRSGAAAAGTAGPFVLWRVACDSMFLKPAVASFGFSGPLQRRGPKWMLRKK